MRHRKILPGLENYFWLEQIFSFFTPFLLFGSQASVDFADERVD